MSVEQTKTNTDFTKGQTKLKTNRASLLYDTPFQKHDQTKFELIWMKTPTQTAMTAETHSFFPRKYLEVGDVHRATIEPRSIHDFDGNLGITLLGKADDAGVLSTYFGKLDLADVAELVT